MSECWGCEFVDDGEFGRPFTRQERQLLPFSMVEKIVDEPYLASLLIHDSQHINELAVSIQAFGIKRPLTVVVDNENIRLQDGNHRFLAARQLNLQYLPVELVEVEKIQARSMKLKKFIYHILENQWALEK